MFLCQYNGTVFTRVLCCIFGAKMFRVRTKCALFLHLPREKRRTRSEDFTRFPFLKHVYQEFASKAHEPTTCKHRIDIHTASFEVHRPLFLQSDVRWQPSLVHYVNS